MLVASFKNMCQSLLSVHRHGWGNMGDVEDLPVERVSLPRL